MKASVPQPPKHTSYLKHRSQVAWQIILPVVIGALVLIGVVALLSLGAAQGQADVGRMAAISMIWLTLPVLVMGLIFLVVLLALAYLIGRGMEFIPNVTGRVQDFAYRIEGGVKRLTRAAARPVTLVDEVTSRIKGYLGRR